MSFQHNLDKWLLQSKKENCPYCLKAEGPMQWSTSSSRSNLLGLAGGGQAGFINYERTVFAHPLELSVAGYLHGTQERGQRHFASPADQADFSAALEAELKAAAEVGRLREPFFDYMIMARKA